MPQILNFRLFSAPSLFRFKSSSYFYLLSNTKTKSLAKHLPSSLTTTVFSYSSPRERNIHPRIRSREKSTMREDTRREKDKEKLLSMEETTSTGSVVGFNKRRAEGRDKKDNPKTLQLKARKLNPVNTLCYVQILGTGLDTQDTSPSVLLFFDRQRFIFNAGEGLQRFCTEHKIKLSKIDHIFLSRVCSETAGGLPGLLLTLAGMGDEGMSVNIHGPSDLKYLVDAMRSFIPSAAMVHTRSFGPASNSSGSLHFDHKNFSEPILLIDDEVVKISAILLRPRSSEGSQSRNGDLPSHSHDPNEKNGVTLKPGDVSVVYVCELPEIKGKFDPEKAKALGLRPGPKYRDLQLGMSVTSDHKNITVHPSDVLGPSIPGPIVVLVDCPGPSYMQELLGTESLNSYYADSKDASRSVNCVIHLSPSSVTKTADYQTWMRRFGETQHVMAGHEIKNIEIPILKASARIATRLNYLCPQFFPAPGFWAHQNLKNIGSESMASNEGSLMKSSKSSAAENLLKFHLRPYSHLGLDRSVIPDLLSPKEVVSELLLEIPEIADAAEEVNHLWANSGETENVMISSQEDVVITEEPWINGNSSLPNLNLDKLDHESDLPSCLENITREDMEIVLLGTGSSQPSKYRNVSSIFINLFSKGSLLLDCGEGTLGQLKRRFGVMGADDAVRGLRCIWISHIHADHHTGLARILALRCQLLRDVPHEPLLVIGPRQLKRFLDAYQRLEDLDMQFLDCRHTTKASLDNLEQNESSSSPGSPKSENVNKKDRVGKNDQNTDTSLFSKGSRMESYWKRPGSPLDSSVLRILKNLKGVLAEAGLEALISVPVVHCPQAFGVVLEAGERVNSLGKTIPGWKLVYSGDTRPCPELIDASHGATVLIHEATFEDSMVDEAIARNHSTTKEAVEVGDSAGAYRIILTHFSQRYPKIPVFDETHMHKTCIGFDMMSVNVADLPVLPKVLPYLKLLFKNEMIVDESDDVSDSLL